MAVGKEEDEELRKDGTMPTEEESGNIHVQQQGNCNCQGGCIDNVKDEGGNSQVERCGLFEKNSLLAHLLFQFVTCVCCLVDDDVETIFVIY